MHIPIAERLRPKTLDNFIGQKKLLGAGKSLHAALVKGQLHSMIFWGPPGTGKTTLAEIIASNFNCHYFALSAITSGVKDIKQIADGAKKSMQPTVIFIDEIHRFSKSQQDVLLPFIEKGILTLIGATTENPSFSLNNALLSRVTLYPFERLSTLELAELFARASDEAVICPEDAKETLIQLADGDGRRLINLLQMVSHMADMRDDRTITDEIVATVAREHSRYFDNKGDLFYELISALHKSVRGSDMNAALYWCVRLLEAGCDPRYVARRLIRIASEDIGLADLNAMTMAHNALKTYEILGSPEGELAIEQAALYLAACPKSNAIYKADSMVRETIRKTGALEVPLHLRNAPNKLMKSMGYGKRYRYAHDYPYAYVPNEQYLPDQLTQTCFYQPTDRGFEQKILEKQKKLMELDNVASSKEKVAENV